MNTLQEQIEDAGPWFHTLKFPDGTVTKGRFDQTPVWDAIKPRMAPVESGTALDIGCNGGYFTIQLEKLGYEVDALDREPRHMKQMALVKDQFDLRCKIIQGELTTYDFQKQYDLVFFLGVLYHMENPVLGLQKTLDLARHFVVLETAVSLKEGSVIEFFNYDPPYCNSCVPTYEALHKMVKYCGGEVSWEKWTLRGPDNNRLIMGITPNVWKPSGPEVWSRHPSTFVKVGI